MPCDYISFKPNKQCFAINFNSLSLMSLSIIQSFETQQRKMPELWLHVYGLYFPSSEQQTSVFQWHLGYSLKISNPNGKKCEKISCSQKYCQKNIFRGFCLNRNSNHFPESGPEPKLKRSAQISGFSFISYQIITYKFIFESNLDAQVCECEGTHSKCDTGVQSMDFISVLANLYSLTETPLLICHMKVLYIWHEWCKVLST